MKKPNWFRRNPDLIAVTCIVLCMGVASAITAGVQRFPVHRMEPVVESVEPHITEIRDDGRSLLREVGSEIRTQVQRHHEELREDLRNNAGSFRCDMKRLHQDSIQFRDEIRQLRDRIREQLQEIVHKERYRRFD